MNSPIERIKAHADYLAEVPHNKQFREDLYALVAAATAATAPAAVAGHPWAQVPAWLDEAADDIANWGGYAAECWQKKHNLTGCVADYRNRASVLRAMLADAP